MKKNDTYTAIQEMKANGLTRHQASIRLNINYCTACKYWDITPQQYQQMVAEKETTYAINKYRDGILECLHKYPEMSSAQIRDWICMKQDVASLDVSDRMFQKCVAKLRAETGIRKPAKISNAANAQDPVERKSVLGRLAEKKEIVSTTPKSEALTHIRNKHLDL